MANEAPSPTLSYLLTQSLIWAAPIARALIYLISTDFFSGTMAKYISEARSLKVSIQLSTNESLPLFSTVPTFPLFATQFENNGGWQSFFFVLFFFWEQCNNSRFCKIARAQFSPDYFAFGPNLWAIYSSTHQIRLFFPFPTTSPLCRISMLLADFIVLCKFELFDVSLQVYSTPSQTRPRATFPHRPAGSLSLPWSKQRRKGSRI